MERPRAVDTVGKLLALLGLSAVGGAILFVQGGPLPLADSELRVNGELTVQLIASAAILYACCAFVTSYAVLKMRPWARRAYLAFVASIALYIVQFFFHLGVDGSWFLGVMFFSFLSLLLLYGWRIISRHISITSGDAL